MEDKTNGQAHDLTIRCREQGIVTGVLDVQSFDEKTLLLDTKCGELTIKGDDLHVQALNLDKGELCLEGRVDSIIYSSKKADSGNKESILGRLFK